MFFNALLYLFNIMFIHGRHYSNMTFKNKLKQIMHYFKDQTLSSIQNVQLLHGFHLYWSGLDVDLEIDNLENPEKYPLKFESKKHLTSHSTGRRAATRR